MLESGLDLLLWMKNGNRRELKVIRESGTWTVILRQGFELIAGVNNEKDLASAVRKAMEVTEAKEKGLVDDEEREAGNYG